MKTFKIIGTTNGYIAQRDSLFNGKCRIELATGLSLREAQEKLLQMFNEDYETCFSNWGHACLYTMRSCFSCATYKDGTRSYQYDSRCYSIEEEEEY